MGRPQENLIKRTQTGFPLITLEVSVKGYSGVFGKTGKVKEHTKSGVKWINSVKNPMNLRGLNLLVADIVQSVSYGIVMTGFYQYIGRSIKDIKEKMKENLENPKNISKHKHSYLRWKKMQELRGLPVSQSSPFYHYTGTFKREFPKFLDIESKKDIRRLTSYMKRVAALNPTKEKGKIPNLKFESAFIGLVGRYSTNTKESFSSTQTKFKALQFGFPRGHSVGTAQVGVVGTTTKRINRVMMIPTTASDPNRYFPKDDNNSSFPFNSFPVRFINVRKNKTTTNRIASRPIIRNEQIKNILLKNADKFILYGEKSIFKRVE